MSQAGGSRPGPARRGPGGGGPFGGAGMPAEKAMNFGPSAKRLFGRLRPERWMIVVVTVFAVASVVLSVLGPKILGQATNVILGGVLGASLPPGGTKEQVIAELRKAGNNGQADLFSTVDFVPGQGIDFGHLGTILIIVLSLYIVASVFGWLQAYILNGVVQRTVFRLRGDVEAKIHRLPLSYFDRVPRG
jgi:ATP-binding cassette subfamily B multidrug efflux pump